MQWFKHFVDDDLFLDDLQDRFGDSGYAFWFRMRELFAAHGNEVGELVISWRNLCRKLHKRRTGVEQLLDFCSTSGQLRITKDKCGVTIFSPIFLQMLENYSKHNKDKWKSPASPANKPAPEEKRRDLKKRAEGGETTQARSPLLDEVKSFFMAKSGTTTEAEKFFGYYDARGWQLQGGELSSWEGLAVSWLARAQEFGPKQRRGGPHSPKRRTDQPLCEKCGASHKSWDRCPDVDVAQPERVSSLLNEAVRKMSSA